MIEEVGKEGAGAVGGILMESVLERVMSTGSLPKGTAITTVGSPVRTPSTPGATPRNMYMTMIFCTSSE